MEISVIIPSYHDHQDLINIVRAVCYQTAKPYEIVIIDSSVKRGTCTVEIEEVCSSSNVKLIYEQRLIALPGEARNIGLSMANCALIAFIDVQTIPRPYWLEDSLRLLAESGVSGVWGSTCFEAQTKFERLVRDGFYGVLPRRTLPGSILRREVFKIAGQFIYWTRAGEDTEWMLRLEVLKVSMAHSPRAAVDYVGLIGSDIKQLLKKWCRNYMASRELPHFFPQKVLIWVVLYPLLILIAFNWNYLIADWRMESPLYISHATKFAVILPALIYVILRGLVLPIQRGVGIWQLLPARFLMIASVCLMADFVKILVFSLPNGKKRD